MTAPYSQANIRSLRALLTASAPVRPSGAARHQLWHLTSPLLRVQARP